jgi:hypothetical protein
LAVKSSHRGNVEVVSIEGGKVAPREGGVATMEAVVTEGGKTFRADVDVVVTPYYRDYQQTLVLKLFWAWRVSPWNA